MTRVHEHRAGEAARTHEVAPTARLDELLVIDVDEHAYVVGGAVELDIQVTVAELFGDEPGHVVVHRCGSIAVTVFYAGNEHAFEEHPATRLLKVRKQAAAAFGISEDDVPEMELRLPDTEVNLNLALPVGAFAQHGECTVALDLVHAKKSQG